MLGAGVETPIRPYHRHLPVSHTHSSHRILSHTLRILSVPKAKQRPKQEPDGRCSHPVLGHARPARSLSGAGKADPAEGRGSFTGTGNAWQGSGLTARPLSVSGDASGPLLFAAGREVTAQLSCVSLLQAAGGVGSGRGGQRWGRGCCVLASERNVPTGRAGQRCKRGRCPRTPLELRRGPRMSGVGEDQTCGAGGRGDGDCGLRTQEDAELSRPGIFKPVFQLHSNKQVLCGTKGSACNTSGCGWNETHRETTW